MSVRRKRERRRIKIDWKVRNNTHKCLIRLFFFFWGGGVCYCVFLMASLKINMHINISTKGKICEQILSRTQS